MTLRRIQDADELGRIRRSGAGFLLAPFNRRVHAASCDEVARMTLGSPKLHATTAHAVREYLVERGRQYPDSAPFRRCEQCAHHVPRSVLPADDAAPPSATPSATAPPPAVGSREARTEAPGSGSSGVSIDTDVYVPFEPRSGSAALRLRAELRERLEQLTPRAGEVLHARFLGPLPPRADVENLLLYNVLSGGLARRLLRNGVRFEHVPAGPARARFSYRYSLSAPGGEFEEWTTGEPVVRWEGVPVSLAGERLLTRTWWALRGARCQVAAPLSRDARFALRLRLVVPADFAGPSVEHVKSLVDGAVAALQWHPADDSRPEVTARLAAYLDAPAAEVAAALDDRSRAVLGRAEGAPHLTRSFVHWHPDDTRLVAAELIVESGAVASAELSGGAFGATQRDAPSEP